MNMDQLPAPPEEYVSQIGRMAKRIRMALDVGMRPRFVMPPKGLMVVCELGQVARFVCLNEDARTVVESLMAMDPDRQPTLVMLDVALEAAELMAERMGISAFVEALRGAVA